MTHGSAKHLSMTEDTQNQNSTKDTMKSMLIELAKVGKLAPKWCIYRVPKRLRQVNPDAYTPHLISIGPFHYEETGLSDMQAHKWRYTLYLLQRVIGADNDMSFPLRSCIDAIFLAEKEIRDSYAATINLTSEQMAKMVLLDSCFILELFFRFSERELSDKVQNDPVFQSEWILSTLRRDLSLLENQVPFFMLTRLFLMVVEHNPDLRADYLPRMAFNFFYGSSPEEKQIQIPLPLLESASSYGINECKHLLDLLLKCRLPWPPQIRPSRSMTSTTAKARASNVPNVKSLINARCNIRSINTNNLFDVKFDKGELQLPALHIHEWTGSLFRNLIAYEHCHPHIGGSYIVSYIILMARLINDKEDVHLLQKNKVITVELGGVEDVTNFFEDISRQVIVKDFYFEDQCERMQKLCKERWRRDWLVLKQYYLKDIWNMVALAAGTILLVCTIIQTYNSFKKNN